MTRTALRIRALTLIEVLLVSAIIGLLTAGIARAYETAITFNQAVKRGRANDLMHEKFEDKMALLLRHAYMLASTTDQTTYFIGSVGPPTATVQTGVGTSNGGSNQGAGASSNQSSNNGTDTLTFTATGFRLPGAVFATQDDFETANSDFGVEGGISEFEIGPNAVGTPTNNQQGVFVREQTPADSDPTQGGTESLLTPDVSQVSYQFYDGTQWVQSWDSRQGQKRLPAAVEINYTMQGETAQRTFIVSLPYSDVTPLNPMVETGQ